MERRYSVQVFEEVTSTQDVAASLFTGDPLLVVAHRQSVGRGRGGNEWLTAPRAMAASFVFCSTWVKEDRPLLSLVAGMACARVVGEHCRLKWPNDLLVGEAKVGGLLAEAREEEIIIGCGINLFWPQPPLGMTGLFEIDPGPESGEVMARAWVDDLIPRLHAGRRGWQADEYRSRSATIGRQVSWEPGGTGLAVDVDDRGRLIVQTEAGLVTLAAGEVRHLRPV